MNVTPYPAIPPNQEAWMRLGRGHTHTFLATDEEVQQWLVSSLRADLGPYLIVGSDLIQEGKYWVELPFTGQISELIALLHSAERSRSSVWIWSRTLTPDLEIKSRTTIGKQLAVNGLVNLQHGSRLTDVTIPERPLALWPSSVGIVDRVQNQVTGETRYYQGYLSIYKALVNAIKKTTIYSSIMRSRSGMEEEIVGRGAPMWTEGAKQLYDAGIAFNAIRPGRRIQY